jgi:hypothetical protein
VIPLPLIALAFAAMAGRKTRQPAQAKPAADVLTRSTGTTSAPTAPTDAREAARNLARYLAGGGSFGSKARPSAAVESAQRALRVTPDGIVGPATRNAARALGVTLPLRPSTTRASTATGTALAGRRKR